MRKLRTYKWGTLIKANDNKKVMQFGWKDNNLCLFQSTVYIRNKI